MESTSQMEKQKETGSKEMVTNEEEINDHHSRNANAADPRNRSEKSKSSIGYAQVEISPAEENTDCQEPVKPLKQVNIKRSKQASAENQPKTDGHIFSCREPSESESSCTVVKKEEVSDILGTLAFPPETPVAVDRPVSLATGISPVVSANTFVYTSSSKLGNKFTVGPPTIESSPSKMESNGSTTRDESVKTTTTSSLDNGTNEHSIRESKPEEYDDGCSGDDVDVNETGPSKQRHVEANTINANECDGGIFTCLDCAAVFKTKVALKRHIASHPGYRRFKCTVCEKRFTRSVLLTQHSRRHTGERPFKCDICEKKFVFSGSLQRHRRIHTDESFECDACEKKFATNYELTSHKRTHTAERPFKCLTCNKQFIRNEQLIRHEVIHTGERSFECPICQKRFSHMGNLRNHRLLHRGEKPFQCDVCEKSFTSNGHLKTHKLLHTGEKPFNCDICNKGYARKADLQSHKYIHSGEKPFKCEICKIGFVRNGDLQSHKRIHSDEKPFKCDICNKGFLRNREIKYHKRTHTGERPFKCLICTKGFIRKGDLQSHKLIHSDEKPYICMTCGVCFSQSGHLQQHKLKQHADHNADAQPDVSHLQHLLSSSLQADASTKTSVMEDCIATEKV